MATCSQLLSALKNGAHDSALSAHYAPEGGGLLDAARTRAAGVAEAFAARFGGDAQGAALFSGPGRTEIGGNHTDHQHGRVLCGSVDLDMLACAAPNGLNAVRIVSEGYPALEISLDDLAPKKGEENTSAALVRGVAARIAELGYKLSGFDACACSTVLSGSGLSSSAAYETLVGNIFNHFCCGDRLDPVTIAKIGQYAENVYFGKPCGLMDQMGSSVGGAVFIDFNYAAVTREMGAVAAHFGKAVLRDVSVTDFRAALPALREECGDRAVLRAIHFYDDDRTANLEAAALKNGDFDFFLTLVDQSGLSSALHLQNTWSVHDTRQQAIPLALAEAKRLLDTGAARVHGGGFAGTIQAWVPNGDLAQFKAGMEALFGENKCHILHIRPQGGCVVAE